MSFYESLRHYEREIDKKFLRELRKRIEPLSVDDHKKICELIIEHYIRKGYKINVLNPKMPDCCKVVGKDLVLNFSKMDDELVSKLYSFTLLVSDE